MSSLVDPDVIAAAMSGQTTVTRRCVIYQSDGITPWEPSIIPRIKDGSVSVDYTRDERRSLDLTLDNSDGLIEHNSSTGLWYDKIVKVYRGITYPNPRTIPRVAILNANLYANPAIALLLRRCGLTDLTAYATPSAITVNDLLQYDIIVGYSQGSNIDSVSAALMLAAYNAGRNILSVCNFATSATVPLLATTATRTSAVDWDINQVTTADTPFIGKFPNYTATHTSGETIPQTIRATANIATTTTFSSTIFPSAVYEQAANGARWFHYHPQINLAITPILNLQYMVLQFAASLSWLYSYAATVDWEIQIGEFMIDKIEEERFPYDIKITGRDYTKRLLLKKFDDSVTFAAGFDVDQLMLALATLASCTKFNLNANGAVLASDYTFDKASDFWTAMNGIAVAANIELFFDAFGFLTTRPFQDPVTAPTSVTLATGAGVGNLVDYTKSSDDSQLFNYIVVSGENPDDATAGVLFQAIAQNVEPSSPTRIARLGTRSYYYDSSFFTSNDQCQAYADQLLSIMALESYDLSFSSIVFAWLECGEIIGYSLADGSADDPDRYLLISLDIPLSLGPMTGDAKRITIVGS